MSREFEMTDIGLMTYCLRIEVKQHEDGIFISQEGYANNIIGRFKTNNCNRISTPMECGIKLSKNNEAENVNRALFNSLVGSLWYLTCTDLTFSMPLNSQLAIWRIQLLLKSTLKKIFFTISKLRTTTTYFIQQLTITNLLGYGDIDWAGNVDDWKNTILLYIFFRRHYLQSRFQALKGPVQKKNWAIVFI